MSDERDAEPGSRVVERLGSALTDAGMPRLPARVFAALMADDDGRMTSAELGAVLQVSPAAVSGAVRYLTHVRFIHRERERGSRKDVFVVLDDAWHDALMSSAWTYAPIQAALTDAVGAVGGPATRAGARLTLSVDFLDFLTGELSAVAERWQARRASSVPAGQSVVVQVAPQTS